MITLSNYERILQMDIEEMLRFLSLFRVGEIDIENPFCKFHDEDNCTECLLWWLSCSTNEPQGIDYERIV